ncbi:MAG TPA: alpha/beta fold hydrolase [Ohtaekwangia sp.]|uniref:YheT family hydrolase n=1 Tax=Ohtaekwangia sp. TaxID=2066019 RepID=UPI002F9391E0
MTSYKPPFFLFNAHLETIYPALLRRVPLQPYHRERIATPDHDFLDLDWLRQGSSQLVIISHGLEGNSHRGYIKGMTKMCIANGYDVLAWNFRGCSGEMNHQLRFYHSGATDDLDCVVRHAIGKGYQHITLIGFSLGGNLTLKYLGEQKPLSVIQKAVAFSVPLNLYTSCRKISLSSNRLYSERFLKSLKKKIITKAASRKELDITNIQNITSLIDFDNRYTAPLHGFGSAIDYYTQCSSLQFLPAITVSTLIINAQNDPFLSEDCYPVKLLEGHPYVRFENPLYGGHVGFAQFHKNGLYWSEERAMHFIND